MTMRSQTPAILLFAGLALFPFAARFGADAYLLTLGARMLILALAALSLDFLVGQGALVSFGHAAYLGIGAYSVVLASMAGIDDLLLQALIAIVAAAVFAVLTGYVSLRATRGPLHHEHARLWADALFPVRVALGAGRGRRIHAFEPQPPHRRAAPDERLRPSTISVLPCLLLAYLLLARIAGSRFGRVLNAIRQNPLRARALGFRPFPSQLAACVIAGAIAAVAGTLLANQSEFVAPAFMSWQRSGELLVMTILGGVGSLWGAVLGAIAYLTLQEALSLVTDQTQVIIGPLLVIVAIFGRRGSGGSAYAQNLGRRRVSPPLLRVEGLAKSFGALVVTDDVNFSVDEGRLVALIGPNGAGKTTLIDQLSGSLQPDAGQILFEGVDISAYDMPARAELGLARSFQIAAVLPEYSALENVALAVQARSGSSFRFFGRAAREERLNAPARAALERVGLLARAGDPAGELSHGEKRLLEIAIALALQPPFDAAR